MEKEWKYPNNSKNTKTEMSWNFVIDLVKTNFVVSIFSYFTHSLRVCVYTKEHIGP